MIYLHYELLKTFRKWRTWIGFVAIGVIVPLVEFGLRREGGAIVKNVTRGLSQDFLFLGNLLNGYFITHFIMNSLWIHIPFLITLVAGDMLAGEATGGTFRLLFIRPASRSRILLTKYFVALLYTALLVVFLAALSLGLGTWLFGTGDLLVPGQTLLIIAAAEVPGRLALAFALAILSMWCVTSLAMLFSSLVENAIGPIVASMAVIVVSLVVSTVDISLFQSIRPWLFTTYFNVWKLATDDPVPWEEMLRSCGALGAYIVGMAVATWAVVVRKDVLS